MQPSTSHEIPDLLLPLITEATQGEYEIERELGRGGMAAVYLARDIALTAAGEPASIRDPSLLDDLGPVAAGLAPGAMAAFLERLARAGELLEVNVAPELILDSLVLAWPNRTRAA